MGFLPFRSDAGGLTIGYGSGVNGIGVVIVEYQYIMVDTTGDSRKFSCLVGV